VYIGLTLLLGFAAVNTGNNLLYLVVAALLAFMAATGVVGKRNIERLLVTVEPPEEVYAGRATLLRVRVANRRRLLPLFLLRVTLGESSVAIPFLSCGTELVTTIPVSFPQRGRAKIATLRIASHFPVAFFTRARQLPLDQEILVFPELRPLRQDLVGGGMISRGCGRKGTRRGESGEIARISDYTGREALKHIHWKLTARHDRLKVTDREDLSSDPVIIEPESLPGRGVEERLAAAAWLVGVALGEGRPVGLRLGSLLIPAATGRGQKLTLLKALALYGHD